MAAVTKSTVHNTIVLSSAPKGVFLEGILSGALKPGHMVEIKAATEPIGGKPTLQAFSGSDGERAMVAILLENEMIGYTCEDEISSGQKVRAYVPAEGEELLVRVSAPGTGTGDSFAIGDKVIATSGGTFIATTGSPESEPFVVGETISDVTSSGTLVHCYYTGH